MPCIKRNLTSLKFSCRVHGRSVWLLLTHYFAHPTYFTLFLFYLFLRSSHSYNNLIYSLSFYFSLSHTNLLNLTSSPLLSLSTPLSLASLRPLLYAIIIIIIIIIIMIMIILMIMRMLMIMIIKLITIIIITIITK